MYCAHVLLRTCDIDYSACFMLLLLQVFFDVRERIVARIVLWSAGWRVMHMMPERALIVECLALSGLLPARVASAFIVDAAAFAIA